MSRVAGKSSRDEAISVKMKIKNPAKGPGKCDAC